MDTKNEVLTNIGGHQALTIKDLTGPRIVVLMGKPYLPTDVCEAAVRYVCYNEIGIPATVRYSLYKGIDFFVLSVVEDAKVPIMEDIEKLYELIIDNNVVGSDLQERSYADVRFRISDMFFVDYHGLIEVKYIASSRHDTDRCPLRPKHDINISIVPIS